MPDAAEKHIRILFVSPQRLLMRALEARLKGSRLQVAGIASDAEEAAAQAAVLTPDVVVLDATRGDVDVVEAARQVSQQEPAPRIVVLTDEETELHSAEIQRAGTIAFIHMPEALDDFVETLELVLTLIIDTARAQCGQRPGL